MIMLHRRHSGYGLSAVFLLQFIVITTVLCKILSEMRIDLMCGIWYNYLNV